MSNSYGKVFKITLFGELHSDAIGVVIDGVPSGIELNIDDILFEMSRRAPGTNSYSTPRKEKDTPEFLSGIFNQKTTGTPICAIIRNTNTKSEDYNPEILRPSHADYTAKLRYNCFNDYRGGGNFSGRLTAPIVLAGAIAKQILKNEDIEILAHIKNIGNVYDEDISISNPDIAVLKTLKNKALPFVNSESEEKASDIILTAKESGDSVGGSIESFICGVKGGIGSPIFESVESRISSALFSIPAVKSVEFGIGTDFATLYGSEANDSFIVDDGKIKTETNNNGGINGGITNGMPIVVKTTIKPTPSIKKEQKSVNFDTLENITMSVKGRHDPCIVQRAVPVIEAALAISVLDMVLEAKTYA